MRGEKEEDWKRKEKREGEDEGVENMEGRGRGITSLKAGKWEELKENLVKGVPEWEKW